ncbi:MAG: IS630 family transposase [Acidobacteriia bacterium]|nr:IS630 family transposase [Terriglobia bacterium]
MGLPVAISAAARQGLEALVRAGNTAQKLVRRARIALLAGEGLTDSQISQQLGVNRKTVALWRERAAEPGVWESVVAAPFPQPDATAPPGPPEPPANTAAEPRQASPPVGKTAEQRLQDRRPASGLRRVLTSEMVKLIVRTTLEVKPEDRTHWTNRSLGLRLGVSKMAVQRVWKQEKLQPHRMETFKFSKDKLFLEKLKDVVGIYLNPPANSVVYCVDEKTGIQALDRTQPGLPLKKGKCGTRTHDYKRNGTTDLFAAYNVASGEVIGQCHARHTNQEFLCLMRTLKKRHPKGEVHIILDNGSNHRHENVQKWLRRNKRFHFHFVPTSSSWTNLVERWFGLLTSQCIRRGVFYSVQQLQVTIQQYIERHNENPKPFQWHATVDQIVAKIQRAAWKAGVALAWMKGLPAVPAVST